MERYVSGIYSKETVSLSSKLEKNNSVSESILEEATVNIDRPGLSFCSEPGWLKLRFRGRFFH